MKTITFTEMFGLALLNLAADSEDPKNCWLTDRAERLHSKLLELAAKFSAVLEPLKVLHFSKRGAYPYSMELARTLDLLQQSGMIERRNPNYEQFAPTWTDDARDMLEETKAKLFEGDPDTENSFNTFVKELKSLRGD